MRKTFAKRMKELRIGQKEADPEFMKKESQRISLLQKRQRASINEELTAEKEYNQLKTKRYWQRKKATETIKIVPVNKKGFAIPQAYRKDIKKLKGQLPKSPSKRVEAVMRLVNEVGLKLKESDFNRKRKKYWGMSDKMKSQVTDFYYRTDVMYIAPGLKDGKCLEWKGERKDEKILSDDVFVWGVCHVWNCLPRQWKRFHNVH